MWIYSNLTKPLLVISKNVGIEENAEKSKHLSGPLKQNVGKIRNTGRCITSLQMWTILIFGNKKQIKIALRRK
jgi:hypothetical protein